MTDDLDIYRTAAVLMRERGADAVIEAAKRAGALLDQGDMEERADWTRIISAIKELETTEPDGVVHRSRTISERPLRTVATPV